MNIALQESFDRSCRLCAEEQDVTILLFSEEAETMHLRNKMLKYLLIQVDEEDKLPKNICIQCCSKLQSVGDFIDNARKAQEVLLHQSILIDGVTDDQFCDSEIEIKAEPICIDDDDDSQATEMEISVDPMIVLQNSESDIVPAKLEENVKEDITYLHNGDDVTIQLIRKKSNGAEDDKDDASKTDAKPFPCTVCHRSFLTDLALKNHSWTHSKEEIECHEAKKEYKCTSCVERFQHRSSLLQHLKEHRTRSTCNICGRVFRSQENLTIHMDSHDSPDNAYVCKICGRAYDKISTLKTHSITHSNERPFKCHLCKKSFKRNQDLKFHINQHTGARPYKCPFCDKSFASSGNCYSHRSRMHPGRKSMLKPRITRENKVATGTKTPNLQSVFKYQCGICKHNFMKRDNYNYHMFQHTGRKPFQCSFCSEQFVTRKGLLLHHDKVHRNLPAPLAILSKNILLK